MLIGWIKRVVPFVLAFTLGLFIASFFVSVGMPKMKFERRHYKRHHDRSCHFRLERDNMQFELDSARRDNRRLREMLKDVRFHNLKHEKNLDINLELPPPPPAPVAPAIPDPVHPLKR